MSKIDFIFNNIPDDAYNKSEESNLYKTLSPIANELDKFVNDMDKIRNAKFIDYASGNDLDKLGALLNLRRITNESDLKYRGRIKAMVPSFVGGGTVRSIKQVIENLLGVTPTIVEHYKPGEGHIKFDKGILNGVEIIKIDNTQFKVSSGIAYIDGKRMLIDESTHTGSGYIVYNFLNSDKKIANDTGWSYNGYYYTTGTELKTITDSWTPTSRTNVAAIDELYNTTQNNNNGTISQQLVKFDVLQRISDSIHVPTGTTLEKVQWLRDNIANIEFVWSGHASSPLGNKFNIKVWSNTLNQWIDKTYTQEEYINEYYFLTQFQQTEQSDTKAVMNITDDIASLITDEGHFYGAFYSDASDGAISSSISTNFVEMTITFKENHFITIEEFDLENENQILIGQFSSGIIFDYRKMLDPNQHYLTNIATITVQIPYEFSEDRISFDEVKNIIRNTKAAGIAVLINAFGIYKEVSTMTEGQMRFDFLVGFSGMGSDSFIGGQNNV